ncbi:MAG TPA: SIMPL domain-containing protein [Myxococcaceae bacterium]|nr:SIMPL domain-containing protein [Myxococcaceae bacterium]
MTAQKRNILLASTLAVVLASIVATVAVAMSDGLAAGRSRSTGSGGIASSQIATLPADGSANVALGAPSAGSTAILQPYPGPGPFQPGPPPYGQTGVGGDGLSAWGVAFKETSDPGAQPDTDLIKSAYQDAQKKADALASAAGIKLGKLVAISDYTQAQPYYNKLCVQPQLGRPVPAPAPGAPTGSGGSGTGTVVPVEPPQPAPSPCPPQRYLVAWVLVRYQIQS